MYGVCTDDGSGEWKLITNKEFCKQFKPPLIKTIIKFSRLGWLGDMKGINVYTKKIEGGRPKAWKIISERRPETERRPKQ
jgi:hypothetical protein